LDYSKIHAVLACNHTMKINTKIDAILIEGVRGDTLMSIYNEQKLLH